MKIILATHNQNKYAEMKLLMNKISVELISLNQFPEIGEIIEDGSTLLENAFIKARTVNEITKLPTIADDTGLEVDALDGAPGIVSARYAGENCSYLDNVQKLLDEMKNIPKKFRSANFRTSIVFVDGIKELNSEGVVKGLITDVMKGTAGFGYDSVFYVPNMKKTYAEMNIEQKNNISHRGKALKNMHKILKSHIPNFTNKMEDLA